MFRPLTPSIPSLRILTRGAVVALCLASAPSGAAGPDLQYDVLTEGKKIGSSTETRRMLPGSEEPVQEIITQTRLRVKSFFITVFSFDSEDTNLIDSHGLLEHHSRTKIDGEEIILHGIRGESDFLFQFEQGNEKQEINIPLKEFDCSSEESGGLESLQSGETLLLKVLQLDTLEIDKLEFTRGKNETLTIDNKKIACRVFDWSGATKHGRRWYILNSLNILIKEDGVDEDGPYSVVLSKYPFETESPPTWDGTNHAP